MNIKIPINVTTVLSTLEDAGFEAFVVGGCVRDSILGFSPNDWDICTNASPEQSKMCFVNGGMKVIETGMQHGTITVIYHSEAFEVTTYRGDVELLANQHPNKTNFVSNLKQDLARRDFTINAMAYNTSVGLVDYFGGLHDLKNGVICCVGDPDVRFEEDALRIVRALRFASTYGFAIEQNTASSICAKKILLENIARERLNVELCKLLCGAEAELVLNKYPDVIGVFIPEILPMLGFEHHNPHHIYDVWRHTTKAVGMCTSGDPVLKLALLFHDIGKPQCFTRDANGVGHFYVHANLSADISAKIMKRLKFDNTTIDAVRKLVLYHDVDLQPQSKLIKRWLNKIGEPRLRQLLQVKTADILAQSNLDRESRLRTHKDVSDCIDKIIQQSECFSLKNLAINGKDLIEIGVTQGTKIGAVLSELVDMVIDNEIPNETQALLETAKSLCEKEV